ncbi:MAG: hypothetical protein G01um10148_436 [Parcubacteria group bacterium Gr01-1014_8]|nr:MAG: hypothetical protein G01um10148_436 [Parcubacteria group bacterium Gr01-1014_8]
MGNSPDRPRQNIPLTSEPTANELQKNELLRTLTVSANNYEYLGGQMRGVMEKKVASKYNERAKHLRDELTYARKNVAQNLGAIRGYIDEGDAAFSDEQISHIHADIKIVETMLARALIAASELRHILYFSEHPYDSKGPRAIWHSAKKKFKWESGDFVSPREIKDRIHAEAIAVATNFLREENIPITDDNIAVRLGFVSLEGARHRLDVELPNDMWLKDLPKK